jgi:hypothetical protein
MNGYVLSLMFHASVSINNWFKMIINTFSLITNKILIFRIKNKAVFSCERSTKTKQVVV